MKLGFAVLVLISAGLQLRADTGPTVLAKGLLSYQAPPGWLLRDVPTSPYPIAIAPVLVGIPANINIEIDSKAQPMDDYITVTLANLKKMPQVKDVSVVSQVPFKTASGLDGVRVVVTDIVPQLNNARVEQVFYYFEGGGDKKLVITASCAASEAARNEALFDTSVKTLSLE